MRLRVLPLMMMFFALSQQAARAEQIGFTVSESALNRFAVLADKTGTTGDLSVYGPPYWCPTREEPERTCHDRLFTGKISWTLSGVGVSLKQQGGITLTGKLGGTFKAYAHKLGRDMEFNSPTVNITASARMEYDAAESRMRMVVDAVSASLSFDLTDFGSWTSPEITLPTPQYGFSLPLHPIRLVASNPSAGTVPVRLKPRRVRTEVEDGWLRINVDFSVW